MARLACHNFCLCLPLLCRVGAVHLILHKEATMIIPPRSVRGLIHAYDVHLSATSKQVSNDGLSRSISSLVARRNGTLAGNKATVLRASSVADTSSPLSISIREAFLDGETDGILAIAPDLLSTYSSSELIMASVDAVRSNKGQAAGIINAFVARSNPDMAWSMLNAYDELSDTLELYPDIVALCNTYTALSKGRDSYASMATAVLERTQRLSKKMGGSKRRKSLAASSRRTPVNAADMKEELRSLYGPDFHVLFEDDRALVVSKPAGMVVFHKRKTTAGKFSSRKKRSKTKNSRDPNISDISLEDALLDMNVPLSTLNSEGRGIVHRLDRGTSGCIVLAKTDDMHAKLITEFFTRNAKKSYLALVPRKCDDSLLDAPDEYLPRDISEDGTINLPVGGRPATSKYAVLEAYGGNTLCVKIETMTGRKHQVRVHCAKGLGRPIYLDPLYSSALSTAGRSKGKKKTNESDLPLGAGAVPEPVIASGGDSMQQRFFLHASSLSIPAYGIDVEAPLPLWWQDAVTKLQQDY